MSEKKKILVVGDGIIDQYVNVETTRSCPEDNSIPVLDVVSQDIRPGGALNTALNVASLGDDSVDVSYCGISHSSLTNKIKNVDIYSYTHYENDETILRKVRFYNDRALLARVDYNKKYNIHDSTKSFFQSVYKSLKSFDCIIFSDYDKGTIDNNLVEFILKNVRSNCLTIVDSKRKDLSMYKGVDIIKLNENEYNTQLQNLVEPQLLCKFCVVTTGRDGAFVIEQDANRTMKMTIKPKSAIEVDVTGCGDTHTAALAVYLLHINNIHAATKYANCAAAVAVSKFGTSYVKKTEVIYE